MNVTSIAAAQVLNFNNGGSGFSSVTTDIGIDELSLRFGTWSSSSFTTNSDYSSATTLVTAGSTSLTDVRTRLTVQILASPQT